MTLMLIVNIQKTKHYTKEKWAEVFDMFNLKHNHLYGKLIKKQPEKINGVPSRARADILASEIHRLSKFAK